MLCACNAIKALKEFIITEWLTSLPTYISCERLIKTVTTRAEQVSCLIPDVY